MYRTVVIIIICAGERSLLVGRISDDIKAGKFAGMYLLYGEEAFLRNYNKNSLKLALVSPDDNLNYSYFEGSGTNVSEVVDLINTMPFMSDKRVVLCENTGWMAKEEGGGADLSMLTDALESISEDVVFILCEEKVDKRSKLYKTISSHGVCEEFARLTDDRLANWVRGYAANQGKNLNPNTAMYFVTETGNDMLLLSLELDKLIAWALDKNEITIEDVDTVCTHQINNKIFDMITSISNHRQKEALKLYYDLLNLRESPFHIQALLVRQYNNMLIVRDGISRGMGVQAIAAKTGIRDWLVRKLADSVRSMSLSEIRDNIEACAGAEEAIKTGNMTDTLAIELLIISLSNKRKVQ